MSDQRTDITTRELSIELHALRDKMADRFASADKALDRAEESLRQYKTENNEWRKTLEDVRTLTMARTEVLAELKSLQLQIDELKEKSSVIAGRDYQQQQNRAQTNWAKDNTWAIILAIATAIGTIWLFSKH
jgi:chromosome segregation ATPase